MDTSDYKPELAKRDGKALEGFDPKTGFFPGSVGGLMKSPFEFKQHGQSGTWGSDLFPKTSMHVDKMWFIHCCWTRSNNHSPALLSLSLPLLERQTLESLESAFPHRRNAAVSLLTCLRNEAEELTQLRWFELLCNV